MALIRVFKDSALSAPETSNVGGSVNLLDWMRDNCQWLSDAGAIVRMNGSVIVNTMVDTPEQCDERCDMSVGVFDSVDIIARPQGDPVTLAISVGISIASYLLTPQPDVPEIDEQQTSNNQFNASKNRFRVREAIADLAGLSRIYPDFLQPPFFEFIDNQTRYTEWFIAGVGKNQITEIKTSDTLLSDIPGSTAEVYDYEDYPATIKAARTVDELTDIELPTAQDPSRYSEVTNGTINNAGNNVVDINNASIITDLGIAVGTEIRITGEYFDLNFGATQIIDMTTEVLSISGSELTVGNEVGPFQSTLGSWEGAVEIASASTSTPWITLPDGNITEIIVNIEWPNGLRNNTGGDLVSNILISYQQINDAGEPLGPIVGNAESYTANTPNGQRRSYYYTVPEGRYRVRATNANNYVGGDAREDVMLRAVFGAYEYSTGLFDDLTIIKVVRRSSPGQNPASGDKINCKAQRLLRLFNPQTGTFGSTFEPTRSFAQYAMYLLNTVGGIPLSKIDYVSLFAIESSLSDERLGYFDFSFDDKHQDLESRLLECCNVARVVPYRTGGDYYKFVRDEEKQAPVAILNRRNLAPNASQETLRTYRDFEFDSVELEWINPIDNTPSYVRRRINPTTGAIESGLGDRPQEFLLKGCQNELQAINRAELEVRKLRYQLWSVQDTALSDAINLGKGELVSYSSITQQERFHGEVLAQDGDIFKTSEPFEPTDGVNYYVYILSDDGTVSNSVPCLPVAGNKFAFEADGLVSLSADSYAIQMGSLYVIAPGGKEDNALYTVTSRGIPDAEGKCQIELVQYDDRIYDSD